MKHIEITQGEVKRGEVRRNKTRGSYGEMRPENKR